MTTPDDGREHPHCHYLVSEAWKNLKLTQVNLRFNLKTSEVIGITLAQLFAIPPFETLTSHDHPRPTLLLQQESVVWWSKLALKVDIVLGHWPGE